MVTKIKPKTGKTGKYPRGKLNAHDEGELQLAIGHKDGNVILDFGTPVAWLGLPPKEAKDLGMMLIKHANEIEGNLDG